MKRKLNIILVDDNPLEMEMNIDILKEGFSNWRSQIDFKTFSDPEKAISLITGKEIIADVILLDIDMPQMTGFEFVDRCGYNLHMIPDPYIILISAYDEYELLKKATDRRLEYLVKGNEVEEKLTDKIQRYFNNKSLTYYKNGISMLVKLSEVLYFKAYGDCTKIYNINGNVELVTTSLGEIEAKEILASKGFIRIHESYLINRFLISGYSGEDRGKFIFSGINKESISLPIGRKYREKIKNLIDLIKGKA